MTGRRSKLGRAADRSASTDIGRQGGDGSPAQLARNIASTYGVRVVGIASGVFLFPFVVGRIGLAEYGLWLLIGSVTGFFALDFGLGVSALRYVAEARAREDDAALSRLVTTTLVVFVGLGVALSLAYALFLALAWRGLDIPPDRARLAVSLAVVSGASAFLLGIPLGLFRTVLSGARRYDLANGLVLAQIVGRTAATVALLAAGCGVLALAVADLVLTLLGGAAALLLCRRELPGLRPLGGGFDATLLRSMTPYSAQVFLLTASGLVIMQADNLVIGLFLPVASVTLYAAAFRLYQTCRNLMNALLGPLVPEAAHSGARGDGQRLQALLVRGTKYANVLSLLLCLPTALFAEPVLVAWAGPDFAGVAGVAQILVLGLVVNNNHVVATSLLTGVGRVGKLVRYHLLWAGANVALSAVLIQRWGLTGVALGTTIPVVLLEPFYVRTALRELGVPARGFLEAAAARPLALALVAVAPVWLARDAIGRVGLTEVVVLSALFAALYLGLFARFGLDRTDRALTARLLPRVPAGPVRGRA